MILPKPLENNNDETPRKRINPGLRLRAILTAGGRAGSSDPNLPPRFKIQKEKIKMAYWNVTSTISLIVNAILIAIVILLSREIIFLKRVVIQDLLGGLYYNFMLLDQSSIKTELPIDNQEVEVELPLTLNQATVVTLTEDTTIQGARVSLTTGGLEIVSAPANIILPAGTSLPIQLNLTLDVNTTAPISLRVPIDIPLADTELHEPFTGLQEVVAPYFWALAKGPFYWEEIPACKPLRALCDFWFR